ncbi:ArnT family glycosyltransferase [Harryflintia acetispora]|uniref:Dolichyl-phosphate-mannose-protein mannosyltransferase n=1 Tax=Harryflintia acetispora TaxID=1849041 RepID=A0A9X8Y8V8_9FIRM|nr:glycosyltransferase family 39 protein [Harryflintia acetispora]TCL44549.1 dolichyl-phosphate-mannose-protein mannosyltransferase [Harryflintia acetispora]
MDTGRRADLAALLLILLFFLLNLCFLTRFPFVHSDESWLAGLSRNMMEQRSLGVTEPFFDLKARYPHAVKSLFHLLQMPFLRLLGHHIFSVRLLSLLGGCLTLWVFYKAARRFYPGHPLPALGAMALLACDVQFVTASHFARQEILITLAMVLCLYLLLRSPQRLSRRETLLLALVTGLSVGLHPNSFLVAALCGAVLALRWLLFHTASGRDMIWYVAVTGAIAAVFVGLSFYFDPQFLTHYFQSGQMEYGIDPSVAGRMGELGYFLQKLFHRVSGTYYLPDIRLQFVLFPMLLGMALLYALVQRKEEPEASQRLLSVLAAVCGVLGSMMLIGRYNQTGIVFFMPLCWLLCPFVAGLFGRILGRVLCLLLAAATVCVSISCVRPWLDVRYEDYLARIAQSVPADARVIANLNADFYFENGCLRDYRNLSKIRQSGLSVEEYVEQNKIQYILLSSELDYIYRRRPQWNILYGPLDYWEELKAFLDEHCEEADHFYDDTYAVRISELVHTGQDFSVTVYRVKS